VQLSSNKRLVIEAILAKLKKLKDIVEEYCEDIKRTSASCERIKRYLELYNEVRNEVSRLYHEIGLIMPYLSDRLLYNNIGVLKSISSNEALSILHGIVIGCETAIVPLEAMLKPKVPPEVRDKLESLRKELEGIELDVDLKRNFITAIEEYEQAHYLPSAMIVSRIICYCIDKIPGKKDNEKIKFLISKGLISKERRDEKEKLLTMLRLSRNILSHDINVIPSSEETLMLLGGALSLVKLLKSIKNNGDSD